MTILESWYSNGPKSSEPLALTHYIVVRADLPHGFQAAQICHAAGESSPGDLPKATNAVVLSVPTEADLMDVAAKLTAAGIAHVLIEEPDAPWSGAVTAIGLHPVVDRLAVRKVLQKLPLLGQEVRRQAA